MELRTGNMLDAPVEAIINTVNTLGVMGKGIALQIRKAFPDASNEYMRFAKKGLMQPGDVLLTSTHTVGPVRHIIHFATKADWKHPSKIEYIQLGLRNLVELIRKSGIRSIAIPPLGCGYGQLQWEDVYPLIQEAFQNLPDVQVLVYAPQKDYAPEARVLNQKPKLTKARASLLAAMGIYAEELYDITLLEVQKLVYFLQWAGESYNLRFEKKYYGPYAENINHVLDRMEGHYVAGYKGSRKPGEVVRLQPQVEADALAFLQDHPESMAYLERVRLLIEGYQWPFGMELLATVHFAAMNDANPPLDEEAAIHAVQLWSAAKKEKFEERFIRKAYHRLREQGWFSPVQSQLVLE